MVDSRPPHPTASISVGQSARPRAIAFYLPQFHPIPENDTWWGKGFTEWTNVVRAQPQFRGHHQPQIPSDLGLYDLRVPEVRQAQAQLARAHGLHGFCYYHYWFNGRRLLQRPFDEVLASGQPSFPFCLCWANESWTRTWDGRSRDVLIEQNSSPDDDRAHLRWLATAFADPRYIRIDGRPLFLVYRASRLPDARRTAATWRKEAHALGIGELYLAHVESFPDDRVDPRPLGFDASVDFQPDWTWQPAPLRRGRWWSWLRRSGLASPAYARHRMYDYAALVRDMQARPAPSYTRFPGVMPAWDNSARRTQGAVIFTNAAPALYEKWLHSAVQQANDFPGDEALLFINAWNEWGEGCHLEPDLRYGRAYLEATKRVLCQDAEPVTLPATVPKDMSRL